MINSKTIRSIFGSIYSTNNLMQTIEKQEKVNSMEYIFQITFLFWNSLTLQLLIIFRSMLQLFVTDFKKLFI